MSTKRSTRSSRERTGATPTPSANWMRPPVLIAGALLLGIAILALVTFLRPGPAGGGGPVAWARLGTRDVHSLGFLPGTTDRLLFGHHDGILRSDDGGRSWRPLAQAMDAMSMSVSGDAPLVIAGHLVFKESLDGGQTWTDIPADLPSLDIHAFARSSTRPQLMWAYLAPGGVYESQDGGRRWTQVFDGHRPMLTASALDGRNELLGVDPFAGLVRSPDGGRTWSEVAQPPAAPVTSMTASPTGEIVIIGGPRGLHRSDDGGRTWRQILETTAVLAVALSPDARSVAAVNQDTAFYRSDDGGASWPGP
jgi:photosystem II stability/assembly factor-like uncharacterized protein